MTFPNRFLGRNGPAVSAIGLGCMGMSDFYGPSARTDALQTIDRALEAGITLLDTGDFYGMGDNEMLLAEALQGTGKSKRDRAFIQVKFGAQRGPDGAFLGADARPAAVKTALAYSLKRIKTDYVDLYMTGLDPNVPIEETIGAMADLVEQGYVRHIGISNLDAAIIRRAHATHPITALQYEYSVISRDMEAEILPLCRELGIGITVYGVLGRGLLTGSTGTGETDWRSKILPRFQGKNLEANRKLVAVLQGFARQEGLSPAQAAIAWVASQGEDIIPLVGARTPARLEEAIASPLKLPADILARMEKALPTEQVQGSRLMSLQR